MAGTEALEAFAWRELIAHLRQRTDVQNIDLMILAGFCRNCLAKWYFLGAHRLGRAMEYAEAVQAVYGMTMAEWKERHQTPATAEQMAAFERSKARQAQIAVDPKVPATGRPASVCCTPAADLAAAPAPAAGGCCPPAPAHAAAAGVVSRPRESAHLMMEMGEALRCIEQQVGVLGEEEVPLAELRGRTLCRAVICPHPHPPFPASIKDGYAMRAADGPGTYPVAAAVTAGDDASVLRLQPGTICRVSTGGAVPAGADAVVEVEKTRLVEADAATDRELRVEILATPVAGQDVRPAGCDLAAGQPVLHTGDTIGDGEMGLLAAAGVQSAWVRRKPTVAVMSTGAELIDPLQPAGSAPSARGRIFDSNRAMLLSALRSERFACNAIDLGIAPDEEAPLRELIADGMRRADVVVTSGGVSMGERDYVQGAIAALGFKMHFGRVEMKPGKPTTFATAEVGGRPRYFFGLPGNPVSCIVCLHLFVRPALRRLQGFAGAQLHATRVRGVVGGTAALKLDMERPEFHRCVVRWDEGRGRFVGESTGRQASHRLLSMRGANGLMALPKGTPERPTYGAGEEVGILLIGPL
eukprot:TRINITY_DN8784_c0_g1_i1.p1 TRINITY_DN8784_c0_g1~~TRINITY_DN8784_c0_g1_i1.p1  ORF type:complete len:583 (+),score=183.12 TRINITY_DN8784_c0_g1_i1:85-1833(+)